MDLLDVFAHNFVKNHSFFHHNTLLWVQISLWIHFWWKHTCRKVSDWFQCSNIHNKCDIWREEGCKFNLHETRWVSLDTTLSKIISFFTIVHYYGSKYHSGSIYDENTHDTRCLIGSNVTIFITNVIIGESRVVNSIHMKPGGCFCTKLCQKSFIFSP